MPKGTVIRTPRAVSADLEPLNLRTRTGPGSWRVETDAHTRRDVRVMPNLNPTHSAFTPGHDPAHSRRVEGDYLREQDRPDAPKGMGAPDPLRASRQREAVRYLLASGQISEADARAMMRGKGALR